MDWNRIEGNWKQFQGKIKEKWGKLTDDDLTAVNGRREHLEERYRIVMAIRVTRYARRSTIG